MSIRPLPPDAVDRIKSSSAVTCLNDVVCGLLKNSLDAHASKVNVHLDFALGDCWVEDNGNGIEAQEFEVHGGLLKLHHSSKTPPNPRIYGSHGDFLAHVGTFSLLSVTSCRNRTRSQAAITVHNGKVLTRHVPPPPDQRFESFSHGTRVSVRNLFGSLPVRVKQRGIIFSDRSRIDKEWFALVKQTASFLLAWPLETSVFLREVSKQREIRLKTTSVDFASRISRIFTQAGLADSEDGNSWIPVSAASRRATIKGAISTNPVATRRSQIMSLGIRPISNDFGTNVLYEEVNKIFKASSFGATMDDDDSEEAPRQSQIKSKKSIERWPMFFFEVHLIGIDEVSAFGDVLGQSQQSLQVIIDLLRTVCYDFLKRCKLQPKHIGRPATKTNEDQAGRSSRPNGLLHHAAGSDSEQSRLQSTLSSWDHIKMGQPIIAKTKAKQDRHEECHSRPSTRRLVGKDGMLLRKPFDDVEDEVPTSAPAKLDRAQAGSVTEVATRAAPKGSLGPGPRSSETAPIESSEGLESLSGPQPQEWLRQTLRSWKNPVFETTEPSLPSVHFGPGALQRQVAAKGDGASSRFYADENDVQFEAFSMGLNGRLSRTALADAEVIGQVDHKFILLQLPLKPLESTAVRDPSSALVMLDQHAADERCRLEDLMSCYFEAGSDPLHAVTEALDRPIMFEISSREAQLLAELRVHFRSWGIYCQTDTPKQMNNVGVQVSRLPRSITERCRVDPKLVIDLVRKEIWKLEERGTPPRPTHESGRSWVSCFHNCPEGILALLHSRSCRSAIMFNDALTADECRQLVQRLSRCAFPFQCAHGRPSMVPLVDIGPGSGRLGSWQDTKPALDLERWKQWAIS